MLSIVFVLILQIQYGQYFVCPYLTSTLSSVLSLSLFYKYSMVSILFVLFYKYSMDSILFVVILQIQYGQYFIGPYLTSTVWPVSVSPSFAVVATVGVGQLHVFQPF